MRFVRRRPVIAALLAAGAIVACAAAWVAWPLPDDVRRAELPGGTGITLTDREGVVLRTTRAADGSRVRWMPLAAIDPDIVAAFITVEDQRFFTHHGIDWMGVARAARDNLRARRVVSGASTITMQLARSVRPVDHGWTSKLRQAMWALRLEAHLTKQEILERYLNRVDMGQGAVGVGAAAALYFDADAAELSLSQASLLAGIAHAPGRDNPFVSPERAAARRKFALARLVSAGYAQENEAAMARAEPLIAPREDAPFLAPHFTSRMLSRLEDEAAQCDCPAAGTIRTTLDLTLQAQLESEVRATVLALHDRGVEHAAAVVIDNATGAVRAWVGSPISGRTPRGRRTWSCRRGSRDRRSSPSSMDWPSTAATRRPRCSRMWRTATSRRRARTGRGTTTGDSTVPFARARRWRVRTTCRRWRSPIGWAPPPCSGRCAMRGSRRYRIRRTTMD